MSEKSVRVAWILWAAMHLALANYAVLVVITPAPPDLQVPQHMAMLVAVLGFGAVVMAGSSLLLAPLLGRLFHSFWVYYVARLLFAESIGTLALVLAFMGAAPVVSLAFGGVALALLLIAAPTARHREAALERI